MYESSEDSNYSAVSTLKPNNKKMISQNGPEDSA